MMNLKIIVIYCIVLVLNAKRIEKRLIGGQPATDREFPYQGSLLIKSKYVCAATLISPSQLVTTATCVQIALQLYPNVTDVQVLLGSRHLFHGILYYVKRISHHRDFQFSSASLSHNIGVVHLAHPADLCYNIIPISLPPQNLFLPNGTLVWVSGFGSTTARGHPSRVLRKLRLTTIGLEECQQRLINYTLYESNICVIPGPNRGCSEGDNGNPMVDSSKSFVIGIISTGVDFDSGTVEIFTNVGHYIEYIQEEINFNPEHPKTSRSHPAVNYQRS